jgi:hypothetical protein
MRLTHRRSGDRFAGGRRFDGGATNSSCGEPAAGSAAKIPVQM